MAEQRCAGCGHRWEVPATTAPVPVALCGDCWRKVASFLLRGGTWPIDSVQAAFVEGARWWQFHKNGATMFSSERHEAETEALKRYGDPKP